MLNLNILLHVLNYADNDNITSLNTNYSYLLVCRTNNILVFKTSIKSFYTIIYFNTNFIFFKVMYTFFLHFIIYVSVSFIII